MLLSLPDKTCFSLILNFFLIAVFSVHLFYFNYKTMTIGDLIKILTALLQNNMLLWTVS